MSKRRIVASRRRPKTEHSGRNSKALAKEFVAVYAELAACDLDREDRIDVATRIIGLPHGHFGGGH